MKTNLVFMLSLLFLASACTEEAANFGKTDCYWKIKNHLDDMEEKYQDEMTNYVDEDGNVSSTKVCQFWARRTNLYWHELGWYKDSEFLDCTLTGEELIELEARIDDRIVDLKKAQKEVYNCDS